MALPFETDEPDLFLEHNGVSVYHCYNGDEMGPAHETYEFSLNTCCGYRRCDCGLRCKFQFDVRRLPNYKEWPKPLTVSEPGALTEWNMNAWKVYFSSQAEFHKDVICRAIDLGYLTRAGVKLPPKPPGKNVQ